MSTENVVQIGHAPAVFVPAWTFADRLRKARQIAGLDQREFAKQLGCGASAYAQWEAGNNKPRDLVLMAQQVQAITGVAAIWLLGIDPQGTQKAPATMGEGQVLLPEMDSNHQPADFKPAAISALTDDELATVPEHDAAPIITLAERRAQSVSA